MSESDDKPTRTFLGRVLAAATALVPILVLCGAVGVPYIKEQVRLDWERAVTDVRQSNEAAIKETKAQHDASIAEVKAWLIRISEKLDRMAEHR